MKNKNDIINSENLEKIHANTHKRTWISPDLCIWDMNNIEFGVKYGGIDGGTKTSAV